MDNTAIFARAQTIAEEASKKVVQNLEERSDAPLSDEERERVSRASFDTAYGNAIVRLVRSLPIIALLGQNDILLFVGPRTQRGFTVIIREEQPEFVTHIEQVVGRSLDTGTILYPCLFGEYAKRLAEVNRYKTALAIYHIKSEIITIPNPGTEEDLAVLFVPLFRS